MNTTNITCKLQQIDDNENEILLTAFNFYFDEKTYLISTHHFLPIKSCYINNDTTNQVNIHINSVWNELIIFKTENEIPNIKTFAKHLNTDIM